jgi:hypothetical protein
MDFISNILFLKRHGPPVCEPVMQSLMQGLHVGTLVKQPWITTVSIDMLAGLATGSLLALACMDAYLPNSSAKSTAY